MEVRALKYFSFLLIPISVVFSFIGDGLWTFSALIFAFGIIPFVELLLPPNSDNIPEAEQTAISRKPIYDLIIFLTIPIQIGFLIWFLTFIGDPMLSTTEIIGKTTAMGLMCGVYGINVAHELGHRRSIWSRRCAKLLLATSLYMHFYIEHNKGHHKNVGTPDDPATARFNENVYAFWVRSVFRSYFSAWKIQSAELRRARQAFLSPKNEMLIYQVVHVSLLVSIWLIFGLFVTFCFGLAAIMGMLLLETVNYIEHYGLMRPRISKNRYANVQAEHSWNSDHILGRLVLFELTRHSDHHHNVHKKHQQLDSLAEAPQLPTGYPGMMVLSLLPALWFAVMNPRIDHKPSSAAAF